MTTTTTLAPSRRPSGPWLPAISLVVASGAVALGVVAIATDDVSDRPAQIVVDPPAPIPADIIKPPGGANDAAPVACRGQARLRFYCYQ